MSPNEVINKMRVAIEKLHAKEEELKELSIKKAEAQRTYSIERARAIARLRVHNTPVGVINEIVDGEVSSLRLEMELQEDAYYICLQAIENLRKELETYRGILSFLKVEYSTS